MRAPSRRGGIARVVCATHTALNRFAILLQSSSRTMQIAARTLITALCIRT